LRALHLTIVQQQSTPTIFIIDLKVKIIDVPHIELKTKLIDKIKIKTEQDHIYLFDFNGHTSRKSRSLIQFPY